MYKILVSIEFNCKLVVDLAILLLFIGCFNIQACWLPIILIITLAVKIKMVCKASLAFAALAVFAILRTVYTIIFREVRLRLTL